ncbi:hypothetical protein SAMN05444161_1329 [Rhizobiales bacterium GAS191]|jgi:hypothetical protein|nr:hypothetical protein SAMN05519103_00441 [Rhizobiales bacterium GAS113]SEC53825.1 hypothetical protein SAMN05444161_1329 [Rhizobiales bacterium GAS191]SEC73401.1 hypothetical protein SAMN05519104_1974 [Rhizobiales bacterium GAS188]
MARKSFHDIMRAAGAATAKMRRDYVPAAEPAVEIAVRLDPGRLGALDAWIAGRPAPKPDRSEAVRLLLDKALGRS